MGRTVNIGILGTGAIAAKMAETIRKTPGARLYAVASRDIGKAVNFGKTYGSRRAYGSYKELLMDRRVQLVYVATPHSAHYENAMLCLEYGKPCLVEKPFTVNARQAQDLIRTAEEKHIFIAEAMWIRYLPFYQRIKEVLDRGVIGTPVSLTANLGYNIKNKPRMTDPALAGGSLLDLGVYPLNFASMIFGDDILRINATCSYTDQHLDEQENITLVYRDGRTADLFASMVGVTNREGMIVGTKGYIVIDNINNFESLTVYDQDYKRIGFYKRPRQKTGYEYEVMACIDALKAGALETPEMPHSEIISIMHMMDFIRRQLDIVYPFEREEGASAAGTAQREEIRKETAEPQEQESNADKIQVAPRAETTAETDPAAGLPARETALETSAHTQETDAAMESPSKEETGNVPSSPVHGEGAAEEE